MKDQDQSRSTPIKEELIKISMAASRLNKVAYDFDRLLMKHLKIENWTDLISIRYGEENVYIVYLLEDGTTVVDSFTHDQYASVLERI